MGTRFRALGSCAAAWTALACAGSTSAPAPAPKPATAEKPAPGEPPHEKTAADPVLQLDITKKIDECERKHGAAGRVIDTRFERLEEPSVIESWIVARDGVEVVYLVTLTPVPEGVEIGVQCPPKPRVK